MAKKAPANTDKNTEKPLSDEFVANIWKPGTSGNPSGRPKKKPITEIYDELLKDPVFLADVKKSIHAMVKSGRMVGQLQLKEMTDRVEGKVTQPIEHDVTANLADAIAEARKRAGR